MASRKMGANRPNGLMDYMDFHIMLPTVQTQGLKVCNSEGKTEFMNLKMLPTPCAAEADKYCVTYNPNSQMGKGLTALMNRNSDIGETSQLSHRFTLEMMGFAPNWCDLDASTLIELYTSKGRRL